MKYIACCMLCLLPIPNIAAQDVGERSALVTFKSIGDPKDVIFHTSTESQPCQGLTRTAGVYDAELLRQKLLGFIARTLEKTRAVGNIFPQVEVSVVAEVPLQVLGQSNWAGTTGSTTQYGRCGPFAQQFTPQGGHKYLVQFTFSGNMCHQNIHDITDNAAPVPVETLQLECKQPMFK